MSLSLIDPLKHRQLFLDDYAIEKMERVKRTPHQPRKCGPAIRPDRSRGQTALQSRSVPQWNSEKGIWEWWYWAHLSDASGASKDVMHYATSTDGESWERPSLGLHEWNGSKDNSIAYDPAAGSRPIYHVIRDEGEEDPQRRYKGLFSASDRYLGVSPDGFKWTMLDVPPIPSQDESHFTYDEISEQYIAMVKHGTEWGRSVWLSTSKDFEHFSEPKLIFRTDEIDKENRRQRVKKVVEDPAYIAPPIVDDEDYIAEVYQMAVLPYEGMYVGFPGIFNPVGAIPPPHMNFTRINQVEVTASRDLYQWERVGDRKVFIGIEPWDGERYDTSQVLLCGRPIVRQDKGEIWIYYNALRVPGGRDNYREFNRDRELFRLNVDPEVFNDGGALNLAKLRLDGFVSLDGEEQGVVVTKPFMLKGESVYVNADARWGELHAEIMDAETMKTHPGFVVWLGKTNAVKGDHLRAQITWKDNPELVFEKPVRLRFILRQARLYSFWLE